LNDACIKPDWEAEALCSQVGCSFVRPFVCYQTFVRDILMQIGTSGSWV